MEDRKKSLLVVSIVLAFLFVGGITYWIISINNEKKQLEAYEQLQEEQAAVEEPAVEETIEPETVEEVDILTTLGITVPEKDIDWETYASEQPNMYAWIYVPDATSKGDVDYPVFQHPDDNSYYLNYNMDGSKGFPGCIYTELYNSKDFTDPNTVMYGHNLSAGGMFSSLHDFEDEDFFYGDNHYIFVYTPDYTYVYEIFSVVEYSNIHLLDNFDMTNDEVFEDFITDLKNCNIGVNNYKDDVEVGAGDKILTLSTCTSAHDGNYRYLVVGVLLNPLEDGEISE